MSYRFHRLSPLSLALAFSLHATAQTTARNLHGTVKDPVGSPVANARVELLSGNKIVASASSGPDGVYHLTVPASARYTLRAAAPSFDVTLTPSRFLSSASQATIDLTLATPTHTEEVTVTANGTPTPLAQVAASVTVLPSEEYRFMPEVQEPLRLVPGVQITQTGQMGGTSGLNIRGSETDATKVLLDGVPVNTIGGGVEFANLATVGIQSIEVLREANSALYGSDTVAGVVSLTTARGTTRLPFFTYAGDGGNFRTYRNEVTAGTVYRQFDLYSAFARIDTRNSLPNSKFHNATYAGNFGWTPNPANDLRFTVRHTAVSGGQPGAIAINGIADDSQAKEQDTYYNGVWNNQTTNKWHNQLRYGGLRLHSAFNSFGGTGIPDGFGDFDGVVVTLTGANGYSVTGQSAFQFPPRPDVFLSQATRDFVYAQSDYRVTSHFVALAAFKYENESGSSGDATSATPETIQRGNYSYTLQLSGDFRNRLFYNVGTGLEDNGLFGFAATPRASMAYYLFRPGSAGFLTGTKIHGSFGKGIKEPSIFQQSNSLYGELIGTASGPGTIRQFHVAPLGPETSRSYDAGIDQQIFSGRGRLGITYFHNQFTNDAQNVPQSILGQAFSVPKDLLAQFPFGAYVNALSFRAQGIEFESEYRLSNHIFARGGYTYTDAVVENSFAAPSYNTSSTFPTIAIGGFAPLANARPFRIAPHTGYFGLNYTRSKFYGSLTGTLVGKRDDSTFATDSGFGNSLLLPNRNLLGSYQRLELGGGYQIIPRLGVYTNIQNLLSEHYFEAFGYPSLPLTFRAGIKLNFGGESWKFN